MKRYITTADKGFYENTFTKWICWREGRNVISDSKLMDCARDSNPEITERIEDESW
jgi:hypothetical protein